MECPGRVTKRARTWAPGAWAAYVGSTRLFNIKRRQVLRTAGRAQALSLPSKTGTGTQLRRKMSFLFYEQVSDYCRRFVVRAARRFRYYSRWRHFRYFSRLHTCPSHTSQLSPAPHTLPHTAHRTPPPLHTPAAHTTIHPCGYPRRFRDVAGTLRTPAWVPLACLGCMCVCVFVVVRVWVFVLCVYVCAWVQHKSTYVQHHVG